MILCVPDVLSPEILGKVKAALENAPFVDGRATAGLDAKLVKNNLQLDERDACHDELSKTVTDAVLANAFFQLAVTPKTLQPFRFNRYDSGMSYGPHVDEPLTQGLRSDVSMTLFLSDPESYDGGELVIEWGGIERQVKLEAGNMLLYPSTTLHRVDPVTRGVRLAAVSWAQSYIRDTAQRELIFELDLARRSLFKKYGKTTEVDTITNTISNLIRMWSDA